VQVVAPRKPTRMSMRPLSSQPWTSEHTTSAITDSAATMSGATGRPGGLVIAGSLGRMPRTYHAAPALGTWRAVRPGGSMRCNR
jgi:hypothetical protein